MHVLHAIDTLAFGGAERMLVDIANATVAGGHRASVCVTRTNLSMSPFLRPEIPRWALGRRRRFDWPATRRLIRSIREGGVDVVHAHGRSTFAFLALLKALRLIRTPIVFHEHFGLIEVDTSVPRWVPWARKHAARVVAVYAKLARWAEAAGFPAERVSVIGNALDLTRIRDAAPAAIREELGIPDGTPLGIVVAGWRREKGIEVLLEALSRSRRRGGAKILVVGAEVDLPYRAECSAQRTALGLEQDVLFIGNRADVPSLIRACDFAVVPSHTESGPLVLIEFLAGGLPLVASRVGDIAQRAAEAGVPGFVPPSDPGALAEALDELLTLPAEARESRRVVGLEVGAREFDIQSVMPRWHETYEAALATP